MAIDPRREEAERIAARDQWSGVMQSFAQGFADTSDGKDDWGFGAGGKAAFHAIGDRRAADAVRFNELVPTYEDGTRLKLGDPRLGSMRSRLDRLGEDQEDFAMQSRAIFFDGSKAERARWEEGSNDTGTWSDEISLRDATAGMSTEDYMNFMDALNGYFGGGGGGG